MDEVEQQHPIPQQISTYQFRLVGDMTLKQFFQIAGGVIIALIIYSTNLWAIIKIPLILFFVLMGIALAFFPMRDRPLSAWIFSFFRSIYTPTVFKWKKQQVEPVYFAADTGTTAASPQVALDDKTVYASNHTAHSAKLEGEERKFLDKISGLLGSFNPFGASPPVQTQPTVPEPPAVKKEELLVPLAPTIDIEAQPKAIYRPPPTVSVQTPTVSVQTRPILPVVAPRDTVISQAAQFSTQAAPPLPPSYPNTVSGQVMNDAGEIVESAILEIRDSAGRPVRALRSNKAGHFLIVTPLQNGIYDIITEKNGLEFENIKFEARGEIIPPIAIRAKGTVQGQSGLPTEQTGAVKSPLTN